MSFKLNFLAISILLTTSFNVNAQEIPSWVQAHITHMTQDGGIWLADNSAYQSENETFVSYGMEWIKGIGPASMKGKLFGVHEDGSETVFWEFFYYWHPVDQDFKTLQYGLGGALIEGVIKSLALHQSQAIETLHYPDGSQSFQLGHKAIEKTDEFETESFDIEGEEWIPKRKYVWIKQKSN